MAKRFLSLCLMLLSVVPLQARLMEPDDMQREKLEQLFFDQPSDELIAMLYRIPFVLSHTFGDFNTFFGEHAGNFVMTGTQNTGFGDSALHDNTSGFHNTASGFNALHSNTAGSDNTAYGYNALGALTTGTNNIAIGSGAGQNAFGANSSNIYVGHDGANESDTIRIGIPGTQSRNFQAGIYGATPSEEDSLFVIIDSAGQLGTAVSSTGATGAIIPFASGPDSIQMTTVLGGVLNTSATIGFGNGISNISLSGGTIDVTSIGTCAFMMPRDGTLTAVSAYFSTTAGAALVGSTITITAQVYTSTTPDNTFTAVPGAIVTLAPSLTGVVPSGTISNGITIGLNIPLTASTLVMVVFSANVTAGTDLAAIIAGLASAGLVIV